MDGAEHDIFRLDESNAAWLVAAALWNRNRGGVQNRFCGEDAVAVASSGKIEGLGKIEVPFTQFPGEILHLVYVMASVAAVNLVEAHQICSRSLYELHDIVGLVAAVAQIGHIVGHQRQLFFGARSGEIIHPSAVSVTHAVARTGIDIRNEFYISATTAKKAQNHCKSETKDVHAHIERQFCSKIRN